MQIVHATFKAKEGKEAVSLLDNFGVDIEDYKLIESETGDLLIINILYGDMDILLDGLTNHFDFENDKERSLVIFTPDTVIPRNTEKVRRESFRATRESLITFAQNHSEINSEYIMMILFSAIIVSLGLILNNVAVIVGGMVIAPVLGPILAISLGIMFGNTKLITKGIVAEMVAVVFGVGVGLLFSVLIPNVELNESLMTRMEPTLADLLIAMAAGAAGAYVLIKGNLKSSGLVGVMVAASLLPVMATIGIGINRVRSYLLWGSVLLLLGNYVSLVLSTMSVFYFKGLKPHIWKKKKANRIIKSSFTIVAISILVLSVPLGYFTYNRFYNERPLSVVNAVMEDGLSSYSNYQIERVDIDKDGINVLVYAGEEINADDIERIKSKINKRLKDIYRLQFKVIKANIYQ